MILAQLLYPRGRTRRLWFWLGILIVGVLQEAAGRLVGWVLPGQIGNVLLVISVFYLSTSLVIGRLHDHDRTEWWALLVQGPPACLQVLILTGIINIDEMVRSMYFTIPVILWVLPQAFYLGFLRGTVGPNRFGQDPLSGPPMD